MTHKRLLTSTLTALLATGLLAGFATPAHADENPNANGGVALPSTSVKPLIQSGKYIATAGAEVPASVDLTPWAIKAGDQGSLNSCAAWAIGYTMMGWYSNRAGDPQVFAPMYLYSQTHLSNATDGGSSYSQDTYDILASQGIVTQANYPSGNYNYTVKPNSTQLAQAAEYKTTAYHELFVTQNYPTGIGTAAEAAIKQALATGNPVGLAVPQTTGFENLNASDYTLNLDDAGAKTIESGAHYLVALGYDANGITVENSWGTSWGKNGFAKLSWDWINAYAAEAEYIDGVTKYNAAGTATSAPVPAAISGLQLVHGPTDLSATWNTSANAAITGYSVTLKGGGKSVTHNYGASQSMVHYSGLKSYTNYSLSVVAHTALSGDSTISGSSRTSAYSPKFNTLKHTQTSKTVTWKWSAASARSGHITKYVMQVKRSGKLIQKHTYSATTRKAVIRKLSAKHSYKFTVTAYNSAGKSYTASRTVSTKR